MGGTSILSRVMSDAKSSIIVGIFTVFSCILGLLMGPGF